MCSRLARISSCRWTWRFFVLHLLQPVSWQWKATWQNCLNMFQPTFNAFQHYSPSHLPKEPVNFRAKGAFILIKSCYTCILQHTQNFCLFKQKCFFKLVALLFVWGMKQAPFFQILAQGSSLLVRCFFSIARVSSHPGPTSKGWIRCRML